MTVTAQMRGHAVYHDGTVWRHTDDDSLAPASGGAERPCTACGLTAEDGYGPDPCLGWGDGPACCRHGQGARRLRRPTAVTLALVAVAAALVWLYVWIGVL